MPIPWEIDFPRSRTETDSACSRKRGMFLVPAWKAWFYHDGAALALPPSPLIQTEGLIRKRKLLVLLMSVSSPVQCLLNSVPSMFWLLSNLLQDIVPVSRYFNHRSLHLKCLFPTWSEAWFFPVSCRDNLNFFWIRFRKGPGMIGRINWWVLTCWCRRRGVCYPAVCYPVTEDNILDQSG